MNGCGRNSGFETISGVISGVCVDSVSINILDGLDDEAGMGATGVLLAAMGLSGPAAGMVAISTDAINETVFKVVFELGGFQCTAMLAAWPFQDGDELTLVGSREGDMSFVALAALDERRRLITLYPHVSAGGCAHWIAVLRYSLYVGLPVASMGVTCACLSNYWLGNSFNNIFGVMFAFFCLCLLMVLFVGYRIGRRFRRFVRIAEAVFTALGWEDVGWVSLRKGVAARHRPGDPPSLGDTYFRY